MKRTKLLLTLIIFGFLSVSLINGQEKRIEKRIKVVVADKSNPKVVIDTAFSGNCDVDSIRLKDGSTIYLEDEEAGLPDKPGSVEKKVYIASSVDDDGRENRKTITIVTTDSLGISDISHDGECKKVIIRKSENKKGESNGSYIYIYDNEDSVGHRGEEADFYVDPDIHDKHTDRTKYVIAKNGIVVTIEGTDETRLNELRDEIEKKLDINPDNPSAPAELAPPASRSGKKR